MMQPLDPISPDEAGALAMENELLRYEVRHLRARLAAALAEKAEAEKEAARGGRGPDRQAYDDIVWLVGRLDGSPAAAVLRRLEGFRTLRARYLGGGQA